MRVSILVPIYGVEQYIERCAVSLMEQTYDDVEYIFVNDCTPDRSMELLQSVADRYPQRREQIHLIHHEHNKGIGAGRLTLLQAAQGDAVMFVDSDDYVPQQAVELMVSAMEATRADIVEGAYQSETERGRGAVVLPYHGDHDTYLRLLLCQNIVRNQVWGRLYRRSLFAEQQVFPVEGIDYCEDYHLLARLYLRSTRAYIDDVVYYYNQANESSYTHHISGKNLRSFQRANEDVAAFYQHYDVAGDYRTALRIGLLNVKRTLRQNGLQHGALPAFLLSLWYRLCKRVYASYLTRSQDVKQQP